MKRGSWRVTLPLKSAAWLIAMPLIAAGWACSDLPPLHADTCGNAVIESGETCDTYAIGEASCRPPGSTDACQLDCTRRRDGSRPKCPAGYGCAQENVCRKASETYHMLPAALPGNAHTLNAGDFDGDGRGDILSRQQSGVLGLTKVRIHFFDADGAPAQTRSSPIEIADIEIADVSADGRSDLVFSEARLGVLLGQPDRTLISETYPTYFLPNTNARLVGLLYDEDVGDTAPLVVFADHDGALELSRPDATVGTLVPFATVPGSVARLAGEPPTGNVFEDEQDYPCLDVVLALRGDQSFSLYSLCEPDPSTMTVGWRETPTVTHVTLEPPADIERGPLLTDLDGDGHLDVLVSADGTTYVAYGDGQRLASAVPLMARVGKNPEPETLTLPLAAGDITGDGPADFVYPQGFMFSKSIAADGVLEFEAPSTHLGRVWSDALIADFNANGMVDVVAASKDRLDLDFYNGTRSNRPNPFVIPTRRPVEHLTVGDLDGDLIMDLGFVEASADAGQAQDVLVAFGRSAGPPAEPIVVADVPDVLQVGTLPYAGFDALGQLYALHTQRDSEGSDGTAVSWFVDDGDRKLMCLVELTDFARTGSIASVPGLALTTGAFEASDRVDVLVFATELDPNKFGMWLVPDLRSRTGRPQSLGWDFDERLLPLRAFGPDLANAKVSLLLSAADLDADGLDELVVASGDHSGERCLVASARLDHVDGALRLIARDPVELDVPCDNTGQIAVADLDADGAPDVLLLTAAGNDSGQLLVLWNDGAGNFDAGAVTVLAQDSELPLAFALPRSMDVASFVLAYVTQHHLHLVHAEKSARSFDDVQLEQAFTHATGVAATDIDGDRVCDLAVADGGDVRILLAELER